jgi:hypothetical protein
MIIKQKSCSIALVSIAMVVMLVSITGAATFVDNPNPCEHCDGQTITYIYNVTNNSGNVNITEPITVTDNKVGAANFPSSCSTPTLTIEKSVDPKTDKSQGQISTYNYKVTNTGDVPIPTLVVFDHKTIPGALAPGESVHFQTLHPLTLSR